MGQARYAGYDYFQDVQSADMSERKPEFYIYQLIFNCNFTDFCILFLTRTSVVKGSDFGS